MPSDSNVLLTIEKDATVSVSVEQMSNTDATTYTSLQLLLYSDSDSNKTQDIYTVNSSELLGDGLLGDPITANDEYTSIRAIFTTDSSVSTTKDYQYITGNSLVINTDPSDLQLPFAVTVNVVNPLSKCEPQTHEIAIAHIAGEVPKLESADVIEISFQKRCIKWCDFLKIFYNCSNDFKVGQHLTCEYQKLIAFNEQQIEGHCFETERLSSILPYCLPFNLKDKVIETWSQELKAKDNCKSIDRCSFMKLTKELNKLRTVADMYKLCKLKIESISRMELVEEIINCYANPKDKFCFNISVQINADGSGLTPILLNFKYEVEFERQYFEIDVTGLQLTLNYNRVLCPIKCECCKPKFLCKDECSCLPGIDDYVI